MKVLIALNIALILLGCCLLFDNSQPQEPLQKQVTTKPTDDEFIGWHNVARRINYVDDSDNVIFDTLFLNLQCTRNIEPIKIKVSILNEYGDSQCKAFVKRISNYKHK